jgi:hypothetical protein
MTYDKSKPLGAPTDSQAQTPLSNPQTGRACKCGALLPDRVYDRAGVWAASVEDAARFSRREPTEHDVIGGHGKRLRIGSCKAVEHAGH